MRTTRLRRRQVRALVFSAACVHRIPPPTSVTIAKRPSVWDGMARDIEVIWVEREAEYFWKRDCTGQISLIRLNKFDFSRRRLQLLFPQFHTNLFPNYPITTCSPFS